MKEGKKEKFSLAMRVQDKKYQWYIYSGFSCHITRDKNMFLYVKEIKGGNFILGDITSVRIMGKG